MEYTKGKWYVSLNGKVLVKHNESFTEICQMPFGSAREADEMPEADANAHLIAAAPKLFEVAKIALDLVKVVRYEHPDDAIAQLQEEIILKAIAEAEGK